MLVYLLRNRVNGKGYVGQTRSTLDQRWKAHLRSSSCCTHLRRAIQKHTPEVFERTVLSTGLTPEVLNILEHFWIKELGTLAPKGYNLTDGGDGAFVRSAETRARMSRAAKGRVFSAEHRNRLKKAKLGNTNAVGHSVSVNSREKMAANKGRVFSAETRAKMSAGQYRRWSNA